jgi:uncharacterized protein with PIN domain
LPVKIYMDHHVPRAITMGLRLRGVDVITAYEDGAHQLDDPALLDRAKELGRALFTRDDDLLTEAAKRQEENISFPGVIFAHQLTVSIGACISDLEVIAKAAQLEDVREKVIFLPLQD